MGTRFNFVLFLFIHLVLNSVNFGGTTSNGSCCRRDNCYKNIGVVVPLFTAFTSSGKVNIENTCNVKYFEGKGVDGFLLTSKTGEGYSLTEEETKAIYDECVKKIQKTGIKIYVHVGTPTQSAMNLARYAEKLKVAGIFTSLSTYENRQNLTSEVIVKGMKSIADCAPNTPVYFDADPLAAFGIHVSYYQIFSLSNKEILNFGGMCISEEGAKQIKSYDLFDCKKHALIIRNHYSIHSAAYFSFNGIVALANNLVPEIVVRIWNAEDYATACQYQERVNQLIVAIAVSPYHYLSATKAAYTILSGIDIGDARTPTPKISCEKKQMISVKLQEMGYEVKSPVVTCLDQEDQCYDIEYKTCV